LWDPHQLELPLSLELWLLGVSLYLLFDTDSGQLGLSLMSSLLSRGAKCLKTMIDFISLANSYGVFIILSRKIA